jgi:hypothetical protein
MITGARDQVRDWSERTYASLTVRPMALYGSAVLRIGYGLAYFGFLLREFPHREALWGPSAAWSPALAHQYARSADWYGWIKSWYTLLATTDDTRFELSYAFALVVCAAMVLGLRTRFTSVAFMLVVTTFSARDVFLGDGSDNVLVLMSIYLAFSACGRRLSLDSRRRSRTTDAAPASSRRLATGALAELAEVRRRAVTVAHNAAVVVIGCQMCVIYGAAALWKVQGRTWQDGTAMYYVLHIDWFRVWPSLSDLIAGNALGTCVIAYATVFVQLAFPFAVFTKRLKYVLLVLLLAMHLGIALLMGLPVFSAVMVIGDSVFLPDSFWQALGRTARSLRRPRPAPSADVNRSGFDRGSIIWKGRVRYAKAIPEGCPGPGHTPGTRDA